jgi:hypothetical protein
MAENTSYFDSITAERSLLLTEEQQLAGATTISLETQEEFGEDDFHSILRFEGTGGSNHMVKCINLSCRQKIVCITSPLPLIAPRAYTTYRPLCPKGEMPLSSSQQFRNPKHVRGGYGVY